MITKQKLHGKASLMTGKSRTLSVGSMGKQFCFFREREREEAFFQLFRVTRLARARTRNLAFQYSIIASEIIVVVLPNNNYKADRLRLLPAISGRRRRRVAARHLIPNGMKDASARNLTKRRARV